MLQQSIELLMADAINNGSGSYRTPTFAGLNQPYTSGSYYSMHSFVTANYYSSSQSWSGSTGVILRGDPIMGKSDRGRNDLDGGSGNDFIYSDTGHYCVAYGGEGNDTIFGHDRLDGHGNEGNDFIVAGVDVNTNASGNFLTAWKSLLANAHNMTADKLHSCFSYIDSDNTLYGDEGHDVLIAPGDGNNLLYGDTVSSKDGATGDGNDLLIVGNGDNTIYGGGGDDTIYAGTGLNRISGGNGNDVIYISSQNFESIDGGAGTDILSFAISESGVAIESGSSFWGNISGIEVVVGSLYDDTIVGTSAGDHLEGNAGNDVLNGDGGNDSLFGGSGNDTLYGGTGNDFYFFSGSFGVNEIYEYAGEGTDDRVVFSDLTLNDVLYGRNGNDLVFSDANGVNGMYIKDWFVNFGVDSFWFTTGTSGQFNYVTAEIMANAFGVTIPTDEAAVSLTADADALVADATMSDMSGEIDLASLAVTVNGVDFGVEVVPALC